MRDLFRVQIQHRKLAPEDEQVLRLPPGNTSHVCRSHRSGIYYQVLYNSTAVSVLKYLDPDHEAGIGDLSDISDLSDLSEV